MKKLILSSLLALASMTGMLHAQTNEPTDRDKQQGRSKTDRTFNIWGLQINIRSVVQLRNSKMILELQNVGDYQNFMNMDSLLAVFKKDIAFYKDSLETNGAGHVRIDYVISPEYTFKKIRFKKYPADGDIFVNRGGEVSKLKLEQDTVHIIIEKLLYKTRCTIPYTIQATFLLDNYTDLNKVFADKEEANRIMKTLESESHSPKENKPGRYPELSIFYNPYFTGKGSLKRYKGVGIDNRSGISFLHDNDQLTLHGNIGAGLTMNTLVPTAELGLAINSPWGHGSKTFSFFRLYASSFYFFEKTAEGSYSLKDNYFVNFSLGSEYDKPERNWVGKVADFGVGYLLSPKGSYFKGTTIKVFTDIKLMNGLTVAPEIISTNNFKQFFPGLTLKIF
jgi:hypothetical protein